jgi:hypothetical protein
MSRSCQRATFSLRRQGVAAEHAREAADPLADDRVALVRHRRGALLRALTEGLLHFAHLGALEVADLGREPLEPSAGERDRRQQRRVAVARDDLGRDRLAVRPSRARTRSSKSGEVGEYVPTAPEIAPTAAPAKACSRRVALRSASKAKPASLIPNVVGSAWTPWVRPTQSVCACSRARCASGRRVRGRPRGRARRRAAAVRARCRAHRKRSGRGGSSAPPHRRRRRARRRTPPRRGRSRARARTAATVKLAARIASSSAAVGPLHLLAGRDLDLAPELHPRRVGPQRAELRACVALDH